MELVKMNYKEMLFKLYILLRDLRFSRPWSFKSRFLGCDVVWCCGRIPTLQRSLLPTSSEWSHNPEDLDLNSLS